jgi:hypothetical protein
VSLRGRLERVLGWATGDRRKEAEGRLREIDDSSPEHDDAGAAESVLDDAEADVRADHGDLAPEAEPSSRPPRTPPEGG